MRASARSARALWVVVLAATVLALDACGSSSPMSSSTSTPASSTSSIEPFSVTSAVAACNTDATSVETAVQAFDTVHGYWPTSPSQLVGPGGYLQTWPNNLRYYSISLGANGTVNVTPASGTPGHALGRQNYATYAVPGVGNICATI